MPARFLVICFLAAAFWVGCSKQPASSPSPSERKIDRAARPTDLPAAVARSEPSAEAPDDAQMAAILGEFRKCVLGFDTNCGGYALRGLPRWNLDVAVGKSIAFGERFGADLSFQFTNVLNHVALSNPTLALTTPTTLGRINGATNTPRQMEFGLRLHF